MNLLLSTVNLSELYSFCIFLVFIIILLALDLGVFNRKAHVINTKEAAGWTFMWVSLAMSMYAFILFFGEKIHGISDNNMQYFQYIKEKYETPFYFNPNDYLMSVENYRNALALEFITGYIVELSLSVDNIFVIILIFSSYGVNKQFYHRVLFWGILGAIVFRFIFIFTGSFLITHFEWVMYVFASFLIFTGARMFVTRNKPETIEPEKHLVVRLCSRFFNVHPRYEEEKFWLRINGKLYITPLFIVLLVIEFTDILFAVDSVPAVFAITKDPYIVFFSNIFAILGLRSMFFLLLGVMSKFHYFKSGLAFILVFVGGKMLTETWLHTIGFTTLHSLLIISSILLLSIVASLIFPKKQNHEKR